MKDKRSSFFLLPPPRAYRPLPELIQRATGLPRSSPGLYSALRAIPATLPDGGWPQLRLLPGLYTGNGNVFIGGPGDADYPSAAR